MGGAAENRSPVQVALRIADESGSDTTWPLVGGLPLPAGVLRDGEFIRVLDSGGREVPAQVDVAATYRDGSIRWALLSFTGSSRDPYRAEIGGERRRNPANGITIDDRDGRLAIATGAAVFTLSEQNLLIETATLSGSPPIPLWGAGESVAWLTDNTGRRARCAGPPAGIRRTLLTSGHRRCVVRTEGWYVTDSGERVARGVARLTFFADSPMVRIVHTLEFTESTRRVWLRGYGLDFPLTGNEAAASATLDVSQAFDTTVRTASLTKGASALLLQDDFPRFAETNSHFALSLKADALTTELASGPACGEWCDLTKSDAGMTVVVRDLAEQSPKALEINTAGVHVHLWPEGCGREWDFRTPSLIRDYWGKWIRNGRWSEDHLSDPPNRSAELTKLASDAAGAAKTHEVWVIPRRGPLDVGVAAKQAHAVCRPPLLQADPVFLCESGALGWPVHARDTTRFPEEEQLISDFFDRTLLPQRVFPLTGMIEWGNGPHIRIRKNEEGRFVSHIFRTQGGVDYGLRRQAWMLYARSGERKYYNYGHRFNRYAADWQMAHHGAGNVVRGGFAFEYASIHEPMPWRGPKGLLDINNSGHDIANWLLEYYLCGDDYALETVHVYGEALKQAWNVNEGKRASSPFGLLKVLSLLFDHTRDPAFLAMAESLFEAIVDLNAPTGLSDSLNGTFGPLYKEDRSALALYDYWLATGDERAKSAFLKLLDYLYRFHRAVRPPRAYQNAAACLYAIAWEWTGREAYLGMVRHLIQEGLKSEPVRLADELEGVDDLHSLDSLPYRGVHLNMHYLLGMPTALRVLKNVERTVAPFPGATPRPDTDGEPVTIDFAKPDGRPVSLLLFVPRFSPGALAIRVTGPAGQPVAVQTRVERRLPYRPWEHELQSYGGAGGPLPSPYPPESVCLNLPAEAPAGRYRLLVDDGPGTWCLVLETDAATATPEDSGSSPAPKPEREEAQS